LRRVTEDQIAAAKKIATRMVEESGMTWHRFWKGSGRHGVSDLRYKIMAHMLETGVTCKEIAEITGFNLRHIQRATSQGGIDEIRNRRTTDRMEAESNEPPFVIPAEFADTDAARCAVKTARDMGYDWGLIWRRANRVGNNPKQREVVVRLLENGFSKAEIARLSGRDIKSISGLIGGTKESRVYIRELDRRGLNQCPQDGCTIKEIAARFGMKQTAAAEMVGVAIENFRNALMRDPYVREYMETTKELQR